MMQYAQQVEREMPRYQSHKKVWALKIASVLESVLGDNQGCVLTFSDPGYEPIMAPPEMFSRYMPVAGDYYVVYDDGYKSFSPAKAFEEGYTRIDGYTPRPKGPIIGDPQEPPDVP